VTRRFETGAAPHLPPAVTVGGVMRQVLYALVPGVAAHAWFFGPGIFVQILLAVAFALVLEALMLSLRRKPVTRALGDYSAVVTAVLFALCIPPLAPWWVAATGMVFAIVIAKHLYGGLGSNLFNPAMVAYVAVLIGFPQELTAWLPPAAIADYSPGLTEALATILSGDLPRGLGWDAVTAATPLDAIRTAAASGQGLAEVRAAPAFGRLGGLGWEWIAAAYALGGLWLLWKRIIGWHAPAAVLAATLLLAAAAWLIDPAANPPPTQHLFAGALVLGAFFIATDPVSGCASARGRLVFGLGVGVLTWVIRQWGAYPDGVAFAVLLMNMAAPLIDRYTRPRIYGHG
jgi:electron transport complex protein RnfD